MPKKWFHETPAHNPFIPAYQDRRASHEIDREQQRAALAKLITTLTAALDAHGSPEALGVIHADFQSGELRGQIASVPAPEDAEFSRHSGLFLYLFHNGEEVLGIQTAKDASVLDDDDLTWLSRYSPEQFDHMREIVENARWIGLNRRPFLDWMLR